MMATPATWWRNPGSVIPAGQAPSKYPLERVCRRARNAANRGPRRDARVKRSPRIAASAGCPLRQFENKKRTAPAARKGVRPDHPDFSD